MHHKNWIHVRKKLLSQIKKQVAIRLGPISKDLRDYYQEYQREFKGAWRESSKEELYSQLIHKTQLVLGGDFHAYSQSQRAHLRVIRKLIKYRKISLALECFESKDQLILDKFMAGKLTEKSFLKKINWQKNWGFKWSYYKPLVEFAKKNHINIFGINHYYNERSRENLRQRDFHAAELLYGICNLNPNNLVYCVYGDLHLAEDHLPFYLEEIDNTLKKTIIFQNSETLYFQLAKKNLENRVEVLKTGYSKFCVITSPPWVKWQSYLIFLEENFDQDIHEDLDLTDHIREQVLFLARELKLKINTDKLGVYTSSDSYIGEIIETKNAENDIQVIQYFIKNDWSFFLPREGLLYLSRFTVNHSATLTGYFLQAEYSNRKEFPWRMPNDFLGNIWLEAIGYFFSKIINHKRKSESLTDLKTQLSATQSKEGGREALLLSLDQRLCELLIQQGHSDLKRKFYPKNMFVYFESARILGHMLGEKIYLAYRMERITPKEFKKYLGYDIFAPDFPEKYYNVVRKVENMNVPTSLGGVIYA